MQVLWCFISSLLSPGKAGSASAELAFPFFPKKKIIPACMQSHPVVHLRRCRTYSNQTLLDFFQQCHRDIPLTLRGAKVVVKPNLISAHGGGLACTHPQFLLALVEWLKLSGAQVMVGDSPAFGKAVTVLKALHVYEDLKKRGVRVVEFHTPVIRELQCGVKVKVAAEPLECDLFVNAPKVKAHSQMYVTLATKNIFGIVKGMRKSMLHMRYGGDRMFCRIILDLFKLLPTHVSVVDGIEAMHKEGPVRGVRHSLGCMAFSTDPVAIDTALLHALELVLAKSPLWVEASKRGYPGSDITKIHFPDALPEHFWGTGFETPGKLAPVRFNPLRFLSGTVKRLRIRLCGK